MKPQRYEIPQARQFNRGAYIRYDEHCKSVKQVVIIAIVLILCTLFLSKFVWADELSFGYGFTNGHSDSQGRCINPGQHIDIEGTVTALEYKYAQLDVGGLVTFSQYEGASRLKASGPLSAPYDIEDENSVTIAFITKPTLRYNDISVFGVLGLGSDWADQDAQSYGYVYGIGVGYDLTDTIGVEFSHRKFMRYDTGFLKHNTLALTFKF